MSLKNREFNFQKVVGKKSIDGNSILKYVSNDNAVIKLEHQYDQDTKSYTTMCEVEYDELCEAADEGKVDLLAYLLDTLFGCCTLAEKG